MRKTHTLWWSWVAVVAGLAFTFHFPLAAKAQDAPLTQDSSAQPASDQDPSGRVARLNHAEGSVSFQPGGENDWLAAELNRPLVTGDNLWVDENSRAEVHIGSTAFHLGAKTGITFLEVSDRAVQIRLAQGSLIAHIRHVDEADFYEIDTPNVAFVVIQPGDYRIDVDPDGNRTDITVWRGRGEVTGGGSTYTVVANQYATFTGGDSLNYNVDQAPEQDGFDSWASDRDQDEERSDAANYVSRDMTGYEDLDGYGTWNYVAGYGQAWRPTGVASGWVPYRYGNWAWVAQWGWTWVEEEPWGFAPFHYGRWAFAGNGWVWVPGPSMVRPVYAPALVGWVGGSPNFHFSAGAGVGWFPLAPGEVFVPGYGVSRAYLNRVNITNTAVSAARVSSVYNTGVINRSADNTAYANRSVNGGVTVVSRDTFVNARPVGRNVISVPAQELAAAPVSRTVGVEPVRSSVLGAGRPVTNRPPVPVTSRPVVALRTPAPMPRSFAQTQGQAGHLNQQPSEQSVPLVRQEAPGRPVPLARQAQAQDGFRSIGPSNSFGSSNSATNPAKAQPRVWEEQGTPEPEPRPQPQARNRNAQAPGSRAAQQAAQNMQNTQTSSRAQAKPAAPVLERNQPQQRPAAPPQKQQSSSPPPPKK
jgi:hypothetical protein